MRQYTAVIYTEHALTDKTARDFNNCVVQADGEGAQVARLKKGTSIGLLRGIMVEAVVRLLARKGRINDSGFWMINWRLEGNRVVKFDAERLFTEDEGDNFANKK